MFHIDVVTVLIPYGVLAVLSLFMVLWDANRLGKSGCLWALIVWFTWLVGLTAYIALRNKDVRL
jgi:hypothetical protein